MAASGSMTLRAIMLATCWASAGLSTNFGVLATDKRSIKTRRKRPGWDTSYLKAILNPRTLLTWTRCPARYAGAPCKARAASLQSRSPPDPAFSIRKLRPVKARVHVTLKPGILDPQGKAIQHALAALGFAGVEAVRQGKVIELELAESDAATARESLREMCEKLLANTVIENYTIELDAASDGSDAPSERGAAMNRSVEPG